MKIIISAKVAFIFQIYRKKEIPKPEKGNGISRI
jgi:hypothetical protein